MKACRWSFAVPIGEEGGISQQVYAQIGLITKEEGKVGGVCKKSGWRRKKNGPSC